MFNWLAIAFNMMALFTNTADPMVDIALVFSIVVLFIDMALKRPKYQGDRHVRTEGRRGSL